MSKERLDTETIDFNKIKDNVSEIENVIKDNEEKLSEEKKKEYHVEEMKKNLKQIESLEDEKFLVLMQQITAFKEYLVSEVELTTNQEQKLDNLEVLINSVSERQKIKNNIKDNNDEQWKDEQWKEEKSDAKKNKTKEVKIKKWVKKQWDKPWVRWTVPTLWVGFAIWGIRKLIKNHKEKKEKKKQEEIQAQNTSSNKNHNNNSNQNSNWNETQWNDEKKKFWDTWFGKAVKWIGIGTAGVFGVKWLSDNLPKLWNGEKTEEETEEEKKKREKRQKEATTWADKVENITFNKAENKFIYTNGKATREIELADVTSLAVLEDWKLEMNKEVIEENAEKIKIQDAQEKLINDKNYRKKCEKIGGFVNEFFDKNRISHKKLWALSKLGDENYSSGVIIAQLDMMYHPIGRVFDKDLFEQMQGLGDDDSRYHFWKRQTNIAKIYMLQLLKKTIPDIPDFTKKFNLPVVGNQEIWVKIKLDDDAQAGLDSVITELQKKDEHMGMVKTIFEKQMQVLAYLGHVKENLRFQFAEQKLLKSNATIFDDISVEKKEELISEKLDEDVAWAEINKKVDNIFETKSLTELLDESNTDHELIMKSMEDPLDEWTKDTIKSINKNEDADIKKITKLENDTNTTSEDRKSISQELLDDIDGYGEYRWHDVLTRTMGTWFDTENEQIREMTENFYDKNAFIEQKTIAQEIISLTKAGKKPSAAQIDKFKKATSDFYEIQKKFELFGKVKYDIEEDDDNIYLNIVMNFPEAAYTFGKTAIAGIGIAIDKWSYLSGAGTVVCGILSFAGLSLWVDAITRAPRKILKTVKYRFSKEIKTKELPISLVDKWYEKLKNAAKNSVKNSITKRSRTWFAKRARWPISSAKYYKKPEMLWYDLFANKFGHRISFDRACEIANHQSFFGSQDADINTLFKKLFQESVSIEEVRAITKYAEQDRSILQRWLISVKSKYPDEPFKRRTNAPWDHLVYKVDIDALENIKKIDGLPDGKIKKLFQGMLHEVQVNDEVFTSFVKKATSLDEKLLTTIFGEDMEQAGKLLWKSLNKQTLSSLTNIENIKNINFFINQAKKYSMDVVAETANRKFIVKSAFESWIFEESNDLKNFIASVQKTNFSSFSKKQLHALTKQANSSIELAEDIINLLDFQKQINNDIKSLKNTLKAFHGNAEITKIFKEQIKQIEKLSSLKNISVAELKALKQFTNINIFKNADTISKIWKHLTDPEILKYADDTDKMLEKLWKKLESEIWEESVDIIKWLKKVIKGWSDIKIIKLVKLAWTESKVLKSLFKLIKVA